MELAKYIDHTLLSANTTENQIVDLCNEALKYNFSAVCVNPVWVPIAKDILASSDIKVCTVIGFPLGANTTETKVFEAKQAVKNGASEVDMVINIGYLKSGKLDLLKLDIQAVVDAVKDKAIVKVIIETALLTDDEKTMISTIISETEAKFVKKSTGFSSSGAKEEDVRLIRKAIPLNMEIKASGGVRNRDDLQLMVNAGAMRIGTSNGVEIIGNIVVNSNAY